MQSPSRGSEPDNVLVIVTGPAGESPGNMRTGSHRDVSSSGFTSKTEKIQCLWEQHDELTDCEDSRGGSQNHTHLQVWVQSALWWQQQELQQHPEHRKLLGVYLLSTETSSDHSEHNVLSTQLFF